MATTYDFEDKKGPENVFHKLSLQSMFNEGKGFDFGSLNLSGFQGPSSIDLPAIHRQAKFAAVGSAIDAEDPLGEFEKLYQLNKQELELKNKEALIAQSRAKRVASGVSSLAMMQQANPELTDQIRQASANFIAEENKKKYQLEEDASQALFDIWGTADTSQIDEWQKQHTIGGVEAQMELTRRQLAIMSEIEDAQIPIENRGLIWNIINGAMDIAPYFIEPFKDATGRVDNVPIPDHSPSIFDNIFAGGRQKRETAYLMGMHLSPKDFDEMLPKVIDEYKRQSRDFEYLGKLNRGQYLTLLNNTLESPDEFWVNAFNAMDASAAGAILFGGFKGVNNLSRALKLNGAVAESSEYLARALNVAKEEGMNAAERKLGTSFDELLDSVPASALNESGEQSISNGIDAASRAERGRSLMEALWAKRGGNPLDLNRLSPEELENAMNRVREIFTKHFKRKVEDVKIINPTEGSGISSPVMQIFFGAAKGGALNDLGRAKSIARKLGLGEAAVEIRIPGEYIGESVKVPYRLRPASVDDDILTVRQNLGGGYADKDITVAPTKTDFEIANSRTKKFQDVKLLITRNGNAILAFDPNISWDDFIRKTGLNREDLGRAWYKPGKTDGSFYNPDKPIESARRAIDPETNMPGFNLFDKIEAGSISGGIEKNLGAPGYYIRIDLPVNEQGFFDPITDVTAFSDLGRLVLGGAQLSSKDVFGLSVLGIARRNSIVRMLNQAVTPAFKALSKEERKFLNTLKKLSDQQAKWFNDAEVGTMYHREFRGENLTPARVQKAYKMLVAVNDIEYFLRNSELYSIKNAMGFQTIKLNEIRFNGQTELNGRVHHNPSDARPKGRIYDASENTHYTRTDVDQKSYNSSTAAREGKLLIELDQPIPIQLGDGQVMVQNLLINKNEVVLKKLRIDQIPYRAGGHRIYPPQVKFFAKQARTFTQADTGERILMNPRTFVGSTSKVDAQRWVQRMEDARHQYLRFLDPNESFGRVGLRRNLNKILGYDNAEDFINKMDEGVYQADMPFEVVYDRGLPSEYIRPKYNTDAVDEMPGAFSHANTSGRLYYSPKGKETLTDPFGNDLPVMDVFEGLNKSLMNVANITGLSPYKVRAMEKWVATYGHMLDIEQTAPIGSKFRAPFKSGQDPRLMRAAKQQKSVVERVLNWATPEDKLFQENQRTFMEFFDEKMVSWGWDDNLRHNMNSAIHYTSRSSVMNFMRGVAFDMKLALFNVGQFPLQISTMFAAMSISPKHGFQSMLLHPFTRYANPEALAGWLGKIGTKQFGYESADEMLMMLKTMKNSGWLQVDKTHALVNDYGTAVFNLTGNKLQDFREAGRFFFYEAERWNRTIAFDIAWKDVRKANPRMVPGSQEFLEKVMARSETLAMNMTEASSAYWQKGLLSIPTQFWAYQVRMMENLFGKTLTTGEKIRLALGQTILYGTAGLPLFGGFIQEAINDNRGEAANYDKSVVDFFMERGAIDSLIYELSDGNADITYSRRAGTGFFVSDSLRELVNMGHYGETSTAEFLTGATGSIWLSIMGDTAEAYKYGLAEKGVGPVTQDAIEDVFRNVSIINNSLKAYMAWKAGIVTSKTGTPLYETNSGAEAISLFLGIPLGEDIDITAKMDWLKNRKDAKAEVVKILRNYRAELVNNYDDREKVMMKVNAFASMIPPELLQESLQEMQAYGTDPFYDSLSQQIEKKKSKDELARKLREDRLQREAQ